MARKKTYYKVVCRRPQEKMWHSTLVSARGWRRVYYPNRWVVSTTGLFVFDSLQAAQAFQCSCTKTVLWKSSIWKCEVADPKPLLQTVLALPGELPSLYFWRFWYEQRGLNVGSVMAPPGTRLFGRVKLVEQVLEV